MALEDRWTAACRATIGAEAFWRLAVDHRSARAALGALIAKHARGVVLDAGAGRLAWRDLLRAVAERYIATDYAPSHPDLDFTCDLTRQIPLADGSVDTVFCCSVLEHVEEPFAALAEMARVVRPGGRILLSVPFRYWVHGAPVDYFRFTQHGVALMARRSGLKVAEVQLSGGFFHEIFHVCGMLLTAVLGPSRFGIAVSSLVAGGLWRVARALDALDRTGRFAQNVNAVLEK